MQIHHLYLHCYYYYYLDLKKKNVTADHRGMFRGSASSCPTQSIRIFLPKYRVIKGWTATVDGWEGFPIGKKSIKIVSEPAGCHFDTKKIKYNFDKAICGPLKVMLLLKIVFLVNHQQPLWTISNSLIFLPAVKYRLQSLFYIFYVFNWNEGTFSDNPSLC